MTNTKDVCLVQMPFSHVPTPSLSLSIFKAGLKNISSYVEYANLYYLQEIGTFNYLFSGETLKNIHLAGEFIFSSSTGFSSKRTADEYLAWLNDNFDDYIPDSKQTREYLNALPELKERASDFVKRTAERILKRKPKIVACACSFFQVNSTIALLKYLKKQNPEIITIVGGANCTGHAGIVLANKIPWIDYTFSGEADEVFTEICQLIFTYGADIPRDKIPYGLIKKAAYSEDITDYPCRTTADLDTVSIPDFDDYFQTLQELGLEKDVVPGLTTEMSRGCWWGEKKPCTFCGLNGKINNYRTKSAKRIMAELEEISTRYKMNRIYFTDNILSMDHMKSLVPQLLASPKKYLLFAEMKSNIKLEDLKILKEAGFHWLQPGIESLQDEALLLMNKGNRAIRHVELLKNLHLAGIRTFWNLLAGFPLEKEAWFEEMNATISKITHLQAPSMYRHIMLQRYNHYFNNQEQYNLHLRALSVYDFVYPDIENFTEQVAYQFEPDDQEILVYYHNIAKKGPAYAALEEKINNWIFSYKTNPDQLQMVVHEQTIEIMDLRAISKKSLYKLTGVTKEVYMKASAVITIDALYQELPNFNREAIDEAIKYLLDENLLLKIKQEILALAIDDRKNSFTSMKKFPAGYFKILMPD